MLEIRAKNDRGKTKLSWLDSRHTFSFADYYDPGHMGFSELRVINDDIVAPREGFGAHRHDNMEIVTVVLSGQMEHKDNLGNAYTISPFEIQRMSAGTGIIHSEMNPSLSKAAHFLQIWILPDQLNLIPEYEKKEFNLLDMLNTLRLIVSPKGKNNSLRIHQDVNIFQCILEADQVVHYQMRPSRQLWLQIAQGGLEANSLYLKAGDGLAITEEAGILKLKGLEAQSNFLIFDLPE
ncbi:MAG: pirin family protein [Alphaproteobacteria bacterium]